MRLSEISQKIWKRVLNLFVYGFSKRKRCLIFLHIPKCGGTSFTDLMGSNYSPFRILKISSPSRENKDGMSIVFTKDSALNKTDFGVDVSDYSKIDCIFGHIPYGLHQFINRPVDYISIVRDPVKRVWSAYNHIITMPDHRFYPVFEKYNFSLIEYMENEKHPGLRNEQSRMLLGINDLDLNNYSFETLNKRIDEKNMWVYTLDNLNKNISKISLDFNWKFTDLPKMNSRNYETIRKHPSKKEKEIILKYNQLDNKLYNFVLNKEK